MERWLVVAGKSGGHILPGLTVAHEHARAGGFVAWIGEDRQLDRSLLAAESWLNSVTFLKLTTIYTRKFWRYPQYLFETIRAFFTSLFLLRRLRIDCVISMGGFISVPVCLAARLLRIPYVIYELNAEFGTAVRYLAKGAQEVRCCFDSAYQQVHAKGKRIAYPLRSCKEMAYSLKEARHILGLDPQRKTICIVGGSQGSQVLNELIMRWIGALSVEQRDQLQLIHQTGQGNDEKIRLFYRNNTISAQVFSYRDSLMPCYKAADLIVTRAGSGILHEIEACKIPALIIPLEASTTMHQVANAQAFVQKNPLLWRMVRQHDVQGCIEALNQMLV